MIGDEVRMRIISKHRGGVIVGESVGGVRRDVVFECGKLDGRERMNERTEYGSSNGGYTMIFGRSPQAGVSHPKICSAVA